VLEHAAFRTAALMRGSVACVADNVVKAEASTDVIQSSGDIGARRRYRHWRGMNVVRG
jgi:hypothetical protein